VATVPTGLGRVLVSPLPGSPLACSRFRSWPSWRASPGRLGPAWHIGWPGLVEAPGAVLARLAG